MATSQQRNKSVSSEGYSAQTELSITVNVRFTNNTNHSQDFERQFTATSSYETVRSLNSVLYFYDINFFFTLHIYKWLETLS